MTTKVYTEDRLVNAPITERRETADGLGWKTVTVGYKQGIVRVVIDVEELARMVAQKAIRGRSGRARVVHGMVRAQLLKDTVTRHWREVTT